MCEECEKMIGDGIHLEIAEEVKKSKDGISGKSIRISRKGSDESLCMLFYDVFSSEPDIYNIIKKAVTIKTIEDLQNQGFGVEDTEEEKETKSLN